MKTHEEPDSATKMSCGNCGGISHELFYINHEKIMVKCMHCGNKSMITVSPKLVLGWVKHQDGIITPEDYS
jgi:uncharacterized Zn finger protein